MNLDFPSLKRPVRARWAPIVLEPVSGSYERLVVGILVVAGEQKCIEIANSLDRLDCLYGDDSRSVKYAVEIARTHYASELEERGSSIFEERAQPLSGVYLGGVRDAEGESIQRIAQDWLQSISSLHRKDFLVFDAMDDEIEVIASGSTKERVGDLVYEYVSEKRSGLEKFFSREMRGQSTKKKSHDIRIDFAGSKFVANIGTLNANSVGNSSNAIKRKLWDLAIERDRENATLNQRLHELLIQVPQRDDPQLTERQVDNVNEAIGALEKQADIEELRLRPLPSVSAIGQRILEAEVGA